MNTMNLINFIGSMLFFLNAVSAYVATMEKKTSVIDMDVEKRYLDHFEKDGIIFGNWLNVFEADGEKVMEFCSRAHKAAGLGEVKVATGTRNTGHLRLKDPRIMIATIPIITYQIEEPAMTDDNEDEHHHHEHEHHEHPPQMSNIDQFRPIAPFQTMTQNVKTEDVTHFYITEGTRDDCVFFLGIADIHMSEFQLQKEVCGIEPLA